MDFKNYVRVGDAVPIQAQLHDGSPKRTVGVLVLDPNGRQLAALDLVAGVGGLYYTNFYSMPEIEFVTVQAHVLENDDFGQPYAVVSERFYSVAKPLPAEKVLQGRLVFKRETERILKGVLVETPIVE